MNENKTTRSARIKAELIEQLQAKLDTELRAALDTVLNMKPERVQEPSILARLAVGDPSITWTITTQTFSISCMVAETLGNLLKGSGLQQTINMGSERVELWISNTTAESETKLLTLVPQLEQAVGQCLQVAGVEEEQAALRGL